MRKNKGFTLIELIVVIVILGILAATAMPKFVDLSEDARKAAADGVSGAIASGSQLVYAGCLVENPAFTATSNTTKCPSAARVAANASPCAKAVLAPFISGATAHATLSAITVGNSSYTVATGATNTCAKTGDLAQCTIKDTRAATATSASDVLVVCVVNP